MAVEDKPSPELAKLLAGFELEVSVGIHADDGAKTYEDGLTTAEVGACHEFGLGVPMRSFVRGYFDENVESIAALQEAALGRILGGADPHSEAGRLGLVLEGGMKQRILARIPPPLAASTKKRRGESAVPLVATSQLIGAIRSKVREK